MEDTAITQIRLGNDACKKRQPCIKVNRNVEAKEQNLLA